MSPTLELDHHEEGDAALPGRRERKKRTTRLALKAAALDLVAERGFAHVTVEDIADAVDVSVRTFFNYFPSKEACIVGEDAERIDALRDELLGLPPDVSPLEALRTVFFSRLRAIEEDIDISGEDHEVWLRRFAVLRSQPEVFFAFAKHLAMMERSLTDALVVRLGGEEWRLYASLVTTTVIGVMRVVGTSSATGGGIAAMKKSAEEAFDMLAAGFELRQQNRKARR